jgi:hypothetical protein
MNVIRSGGIRPAACVAAGLMVGMALAFSAGAGVAAPAPRDSPEARQACMPEVFRLCNEFVPDVGRITVCLQRNRVRLVPDCRRFIGGGEVRRPIRRRHRRV